MSWRHWAARLPAVVSFVAAVGQLVWRRWTRSWHFSLQELQEDVEAFNALSKE